jgi:prepilin-type processing-associated H-X9-DG protein
MTSGKTAFGYQTVLTPNSPSADLGNCDSKNGDPAMPCTEDFYGGSLKHFAARSRHNGGVNVLFADGDVRFVQNNINIGVWQALGTYQGNEVGVSF